MDWVRVLQGLLALEDLLMEDSFKDRDHDDMGGRGLAQL